MEIDYSLEEAQTFIKFVEESLNNGLENGTHPELLSTIEKLYSLKNEHDSNLFQIFEFEREKSSETNQKLNDFIKCLRKLNITSVNEEDIKLRVLELYVKLRKNQIKVKELDIEIKEVDENLTSLDNLEKEIEEQRKKYELNVKRLNRINEESSEYQKEILEEINNEFISGTEEIEKRIGKSNLNGKDLEMYMQLTQEIALLENDLKLASEEFGGLDNIPLNVDQAKQIIEKQEMEKNRLNILINEKISKDF